MRNRVLAALTPDDLSRLRPHLTAVDLPLRTVLVKPHEPITHVHFIESGLASLLATAKSDRIEVGLVGFEGLTGVPVLLGADRTPFECFMQVAGSGLAISSPVLRDAMAKSPTLTATLLRSAHSHLVQIAQTALANGRNTVEQRLARWLLMAQDRLDRDDLAMTHDFLALMLGVRRPGVTVALHVLEGAHAIRAKRGLIRIVDRDVLKSYAGDAYGEPEAISLAPEDGFERPATRALAGAVAAAS